MKQQQRQDRIIPPPPRRRPLNAGEQPRTQVTPTQQYSHSDDPQRHDNPPTPIHESYHQPVPPPPKGSQQRLAAHFAEPHRPPPPPRPAVSLRATNEKKETPESFGTSERIQTEESHTFINTDDSTLAREESNAADHTSSPPETLFSTSPPVKPAREESNAAHTSSHHPMPADENDNCASTNTFSTSTAADSTRKATVGSDVLFLVPPKAELDRISLQTALSRPNKKEQVLFSNLIQLRQHMAIEQLLASQQSVKEQMVAITKLLQELVAQQSHDALVPHVPRQVAFIAPRVIRRRVSKTRKVPRKTILSSLQELDRDLSDTEFDALIQDLQDPSEVEEIYHEYEYEEEYPWQEDDRYSHASSSHMTPNSEELNAFLRESSESSESWHSALEDANVYGSEMYYEGDYYDLEPLEEESLAAWAISDYDASSDEQLDEASPARVLESDDVTIATTVPIDVSDDENREEDGSFLVADSAPVAPSETMERHQERSGDVPANEEAPKVIGARVQQQQKQPPPPPPRRSVPSQSRSRASALQVHKLQRQPPPPPPPPGRKTSVHASITPYHAVNYSETEPVLEEDESEDLDEVELQLLEETAIDDGVYETAQYDKEFLDDEDDTVDENDLKILQLSRWTPFSRRNKHEIDEDDLFVDDDVLLDDALDCDVTSDDFTDDFELEDRVLSPTPTGLALETIIEESSSDEEMLLGESAVTETVPQYGTSQLGQLPPPPPPPPRPPPRPPIEHGMSSVYPGTQQHPGPLVGQVAEARHTPRRPQYPPQHQGDQPPIPPSLRPPIAAAGYQDQRPANHDGYQNVNQR